MTALARLVAPNIINKPLSDFLPNATVINGDASTCVSGITANSKLVRNNDVFVALPGMKTHGLEYLQEALSFGASAVLVDASDSDLANAAVAALGHQAERLMIISMDNLAEQVSSAASNFYGNPGNSFKVYGITGTNGKTTCCYLLGQLLATLGHVSGVIGTLGFGVIEHQRNVNEAPFTKGLVQTGFTTPDAIAVQEILWSFAEASVEAAVMEVSSHSLAQHRVAGVPVKVAIFTNLTQDHLDYHGTMAAYGVAKAKLFEFASVECAVINADDELGAALAAEQVKQGRRVITFSTENSAADIFVRSMQMSSAGTQVSIGSLWGDGMFRTPLIGEFNISNLLAIIAAACVGTGASLADVLSGVTNLDAVPGRMQALHIAERLVVVDYAHTPDALASTLKTLRPYVDGTLICVFGCGGDRDTRKRPVMGGIAESLADRLIITSDNPRTEEPKKIINDILAGVTNQHSVNVLIERADAIAHAINTSEAGDVVLIAGKGHEDYQVIGAERRYFSDVEEATKVLAALGGSDV